MEVVIFFAVVAVLTAVSVGSLLSAEKATLRRQKEEENELMALAERLGIENVVTNTSRGRSFAGELDGMVISAGGWNQESGTIEITIEAPDLLPEHLDIKREDQGLSGMVGKMITGPDVEVGDPHFDDEVLIHGDPVLITALLDEKTRYRLRRAVVGGCRIERGRVSIVTVVGPASERFERELAETIALAMALRTPQDPAGRLATNARNDPMITVRLRNLELLVEHFAESPATREALSDLAKSPDSVVRVRAAIALGVEGRPILEELIISSDTDDADVAVAIRALGTDLGFDRILGVLEHAVCSNRSEVGTAVIEVLDRIVSDEPPGNDRSEVGVLAALEADDAPLRTAAARYLERAGSVAAVAPLRTAVGRRRNRRFRQAALSAIAAIQGRAVGAAPGTLALSDGEDGQLALTDDEEGRLAMVDDDADSDDS